MRIWMGQIRRQAPMGRGRKSSWMVLALSLLLFLSSGSVVLAERRVALVIGNGSYHSADVLPNAPGDAVLVAAALRLEGFELAGGAPLTNLDKDAMERAIVDFQTRLAGGAVGVFYYSGHGLQINGTNFLVPVDARVASEADVVRELVPADEVLTHMGMAHLKILILDACRNNPFGGSVLHTSGRGLAQVQAPPGTLIAYATQPGALAWDGDGAHSPYAQALSDLIQTPKLELLDAFNQVGQRVMATTRGEQQPWLALSPLDGHFRFADRPAVARDEDGVAQIQSQFQSQFQAQSQNNQNNPTSVVPGPAFANPSALSESQIDPSQLAIEEQRQWLVVRQTGLVEDLRNFLALFPNGPHAPAARHLLKQLLLQASLSRPAPNAYEDRVPDNRVVTWRQQPPPPAQTEAEEGDRLPPPAVVYRPPNHVYQPDPSVTYQPNPNVIYQSPTTANRPTHIAFSGSGNGVGRSLRPTEVERLQRAMILRAARSSAVRLPQPRREVSRRDVARPPMGHRSPEGRRGPL